MTFKITPREKQRIIAQRRKTKAGLSDIQKWAYNMLQDIENISVRSNGMVNLYSMIGKDEEFYALAPEEQNAIAVMFSLYDAFYAVTQDVGSGQTRNYARISKTFPVKVKYLE